ncbi:MAG TPA: nitrate- and nitrite sensing domain-containing protein [Xanthobacteraceae bacterium]|nr:nitrate- and nitrite sensing domain-containing protein [Xanthobacteraceae bacterium]
MTTLMRRLADLPIRSRIAIACLIPLLAFTGFAGKAMLEKRAQSQAADSVAALIEVAPLISGLIHELQKERGSSVGFVSSKGQALVDTMRNQRPATDKALASFRQRMTGFDRSELGAKLGRSLDDAQSALGMLATMRSAVDTLALSAPKIAEYFNATVADLVAAVRATGDLTDDVRILRQSIAFSAFVQRKEFAGQERAAGAQGFSTGAFGPDVYRNFVRLGAMQASQAEIFAQNATQEQMEAAQAALKGPVVDEVARMRAIGLAAPFDTAAVAKVSGAQWFDAATRNIDVLKTLEDGLAGDFLTVARGVSDQARWVFWSVVLIFLALLAITVTLAILIAVSITRPIADLVATMSELAKGRSDIDVQGTERKDEIGEMAKAVVVFRDAAVEKARLEAQAAEQRKQADEQRARNEEERRKHAEAQARAAQDQAGAVAALAAGLERLAEGDLTVRLDAGFTAGYQRIKDDFNHTIERLQETIAGIAGSTAEVSNAATEISTSTTDLSQRTEEQAASLEQTSASMEEISATVRQNADNARQANEYAAGTRAAADRGGAVVAQAVEAMSRIAESSHKISDIIGVIDEIARQTNLLALNAAVEAARAGEAGRGFAVVAAEVRSLAQRSAQAAKDINNLITHSSARVQEGVDLVNRAGGSLGEIVESIKRVADIVADIANASADQATGLDQINKALTQMDEVTQQNSALVEENAATAKTLENQSSAVTQRLSSFRFDIGPAERAAA